jgi:hypothetical protein
MMKLVAAFRDFANALKSATCFTTAGFFFFVTFIARFSLAEGEAMVLGQSTDLVRQVVGRAGGGGTLNRKG